MLLVVVLVASSYLEVLVVLSTAEDAVVLWHRLLNRRPLSLTHQKWLSFTALLLPLLETKKKTSKRELASRILLFTGRR